MLRKGLKTLKTTILPDNGAQVRRGEVQPKAQVSHFFEGKKLKKTNKKKQHFFDFLNQNWGEKIFQPFSSKVMAKTKYFMKN